MKIAGIVKSSLIDYPGKASTVVFLGGCNFHCGYCHNREIVLMEPGAETIADGHFFEFLKKRKRFLDGVCVSGGEPTIHEELPLFIKAVKELGYVVKLDTNGSNPSMLKALLAEQLVDYVAMDIKGSLCSYSTIARRDVDVALIHESARILAKAVADGLVGGEFRTTVCRELHSEMDLKSMRTEFPAGVTWYLQSVRNVGALLDPNGTYSAYSDEEMKEMGMELCVNVR